jgi:hypothetical protein
MEKERDLREERWVQFLTLKSMFILLGGGIFSILCI